MRKLGLFCAGWLVWAGACLPAAAQPPSAVQSPIETQPPARPPQAGSVDLLAALYGPRITAEVERLRVNLERRVFVVFDAGIGYVQCQPQTSPDVIYCEAQSAASSPALASVLTPDRVARLHALGYADPGRSTNYWKNYPLGQADDATIAREVITVLHDVYGYTGAEQLKVTTEAGREP